jgi:cell division protease FtsH
LVVPEDDKSLMTRSEMIARLVMAMGGRAAEELVFAEPTTGASSDIAQATKIARSMVTEYGMSAKLGAVKYGTGDDEPFLGRTYGHSPDYSIEVGSEIDGEVRALIEAAHTEAWEVLNTYRDILDELAGKLLEKETLERKDLQVIFADVEKRPRITTFDEFGSRLPSDRPPIKTPGELAIERGEPWPPPQPEKPQPPPAPVAVPAGFGQPVGYPVAGGYPAPGYPAPTGYPGAGPSQQLPPNWTGGVLPGPLAPLPGTWPGNGQPTGTPPHGGQPNGGQPNGARTNGAPHGVPTNGSANGWGAHHHPSEYGGQPAEPPAAGPGPANGGAHAAPGYPGYYRPTAPQPGQPTSPAVGPGSDTDPWAPPSEPKQ